MHTYTCAHVSYVCTPLPSINGYSLVLKAGILTQDWKFRMWMWLGSSWYCCSPPNTTPLCLSTRVKEHPRQAGGGVPVVSGTDQVPGVRNNSTEYHLLTITLIYTHAYVACLYSHVVIEHLMKRISTCVIDTCTHHTM